MHVDAFPLHSEPDLTHQCWTGHATVVIRPTNMDLQRARPALHVVPPMVRGGMSEVVPVGAVPGVIDTEEDWPHLAKWLPAGRRPFRRQVRELCLRSERSLMLHVTLLLQVFPWRWRWWRCGCGRSWRNHWRRRRWRRWPCGRGRSWRSRLWRRRWCGGRGACSHTTACPPSNSQEEHQQGQRCCQTFSGVPIGKEDDGSIHPAHAMRSNPRPRKPRHVLLRHDRGRGATEAGGRPRADNQLETIAKHFPTLRGM